MTAESPAPDRTLLDIEIRPERGNDAAEVQAITDMVTAAFQSDFEGRLPSSIRASDNYIPAAALVAVHDGRIVGHVMISHVGVRSDSGTMGQVASLSPLAVAPDVHRRGVGSALVRAVVAIADGLGEPLVVLEGSPTYYGRLGFVYSVPRGITINLPDWAPAEAAQMMPLANYDPAITGTVVYPDYFET